MSAPDPARPGIVPALVGRPFDDADARQDLRLMSIPERLRAYGFQVGMIAGGFVGAWLMARGLWA